MTAHVRTSKSLSDLEGYQEEVLKLAFIYQLMIILLGLTTLNAGFASVVVPLYLFPWPSCCSPRICTLGTVI
jgi:hypothetical protein